MSIIAIVPIKEKSFRLPGKNFLDFCGKPLYRWVVDAALATSLIDRVYISSSWDEFKDEIKKVYGGKVWWVERPDDLNHVELMEVMQHAGKLVGKEGDIFMQLSPTKPLTSSKDLEEYILTFLEGKYDSLSQVQAIKTAVDGEYKEATDKGKMHFMSCATAKMWEYNTLRHAKKGTFGIGERHHYLTIAPYHIEIDTEEDFRIAEALKRVGF